MNPVIWWVGVVHIVAYATVGAFILLTAAVMKVHIWFKVMGRIIQWHVARARWLRRETDGLSPQEWKRGEPRP